MREAWIIDGCRTPRGRGRPSGALHTIHPQELLAQTLNALRFRVGFDPSDVDDVVVGNYSNTGDHGACIGRMGVLAAGWPDGTPGMTVNRFCGSGQQAVMFAAMGVQSGLEDLVVGAGVESMSRSDRTKPLDFAAGNESLRSSRPLVPQGISADLIASLHGFTREDLDLFAAGSQHKTATALNEGRFRQSVFPVVHSDGRVALDHDEHPRPETTVQDLARLEPAFVELGRTVADDEGRTFDEICVSAYPESSRISHVHHAGNSSGVVDGAAAMLIASDEFARAHGLAPRARLKMSSVAAVDPLIMLTGTGPAAERCLSKSGMDVNDIDVWEINEAFAVVPLKTIRDLNIDPSRVNPNGGAIALGHPIGASGPILIQTALDELERTDKTTALIAMCTGGGMATASIIERM